jgi:hypothetical protein
MKIEGCVLTKLTTDFFYRSRGKKPSYIGLLQPPLNCGPVDPEQSSRSLNCWTLSAKQFVRSALTLSGAYGTMVCQAHRTVPSVSSVCCHGGASVTITVSFKRQYIGSDREKNQFTSSFLDEFGGSRSRRGFSEGFNPGGSLKEEDL